ncbi:SdiA-regulated domain-containing protein [Denitrificimonas caeni]|uniref:SdiA-regulated domain-containing protein n=1 Tax=Denitrificimonas caeni TaxID=521720 RepID=UPI001962ACFC
MCLKATKRLGRSMRARIWMWAMLCLLVVAAFQLHTQRLDYRLYYWLKTYMHADDWQDRAVWLPAYRVEIDAKPVIGINNNLSGLTYDRDLGMLWAVINGPNELIALNLDGDVQARYSLKGFDDVEAVTYIGNGQLVVAEERKQNLVIIDIPVSADGMLVKGQTLIQDQYPSLKLAFWNEDNKGLESLTYDLKNDRLYVAKERDPIQLLEVSGLRKSLDEGGPMSVRNLSGWIKNKVFATDVSSATYDEKSGHLILLSDESKLLIEITTEGKVISFRSLARGFAGLHKGIPQAEGVNIDEDGYLYVVSEPNLFYRFTRYSE